jgi:Uri superfamily endonuclease
MTFSSKEIRCHILDRQDQLKEAIYWQKTEALKTLKLEAAVELARKALEDHLKGIEKRQKHIDYLESTMHIDWIDNPPY